MDPIALEQQLNSLLGSIRQEVQSASNGNAAEASAFLEQASNLIMNTQQQLNFVLRNIEEQEQQLDSLQEQKQQNIQIEQNNLMEQNTMANSKKNIKPFNLKKAQVQSPEKTQPFEADDFNDMPELQEEQMMEDMDNEFDSFISPEEMEDDVTFDRDTFTDFLRDIGQAEGEEFVKNQFNDNSEEQINAVEMIQQFYSIPDEQVNKDDEQDRIAGQIYDILPDTNKETPEDAFWADYKKVSYTNNLIKKIAKKVAKTKTKKKAKVKPFNLKLAQHQTKEDVVMYGPNQRNIDPFYRQPVSDWSIIERNKGFGLVVDDVWDIDYEKIWRGTIMDKYSRPYRDKEGNWVGGYINKRFEVDSNVPPTNNYQLKPGQKRRPTPPEYGNTESRLQHARANDEVKGGPDVNRTEPFNWQKEASKKKS